MSDVKQLNQRIMYSALRRMSENRAEIQAGFNRWQEKFGSKSIDIFEVVTDLVDHLGLNINEKKALMIGLHSASSKLFDELQPVPTMFLQGTNIDDVVNEVDVVQVKSKPANIETTERFFQLTCQYLQRNNKSAFNELAEIIEEESLPSASKKSKAEVKDWAKGGLNKIDFSDNLSLDLCQSFAHDLYVLMTEVVGPVETDVIVNRVIDDLLKSELAQKFNPRDLL
jgi:hypothetical protein